MSLHFFVWALILYLTLCNICDIMYIGGGEMETLNVPKKYQHKFKSLEVNPDWYEAEQWGGDNEESKYILTFADGYAYMGEYPVWYVNSKKEALECIKFAEKEK